MQVKLAFSVATCTDADVLIVDEVLAVGDIAFQQKCIERMERLIKQEGRTVLIVGHNLRQLQRICSRVVLLDHGRISRDGNPSEVCSVFYDEAQQRNIERHQLADGALQAQRGTDTVKVLSVTMLNDSGHPVERVGMHDPLTICVEFECTKKLERPEIVIGLQTPDFVHVLSVGNALNDRRPDFPPGRHQFSCRLADIPLRPANYALRLAFLDQYRHLLWYAENIRPVGVLAGRYDITKIPEAGLVDVPAQWEFSPGNLSTGIPFRDQPTASLRQAIES